MSRLTAGQKARLGLFLLLAGFALIATIGVLIGVEVLEKRDDYYVSFAQSVSGLEAEAPVKYNGVTVGRVEEVGIDPEDVAKVRVQISVDEGTPIKKDTKAVLNMQGITGLKFIELIGGTNEAGDLEENGRIAAELSVLDMLSDQAGVIVRKVDALLGNMVVITGPDNQRRIATTLSELEETSRQVNRLLQAKTADIDRILSNVATVSDELPMLVAEARDTIAALRESVTRLSDQVGGWVDREQVSDVLRRAGNVMARLEVAAGALDKRLGREELGRAIESYTRLADRSTELVDNADLTLLRARDDLLRALDELVTGVESFSEFAATLRDDPSALISGRRLEERTLP